MKVHSLAVGRAPHAALALAGNRRDDQGYNGPNWRV